MGFSLPYSSSLKMEVNFLPEIMVDSQKITGVISQKTELVTLIAGC
jgi:hypothetical protein